MNATAQAPGSAIPFQTFESRYRTIGAGNPVLEVLVAFILAVLRALLSGLHSAPELRAPVVARPGMAARQVRARGRVRRHFFRRAAVQTVRVPARAHTRCMSWWPVAAKPLRALPRGYTPRQFFSSA